MTRAIVTRIAIVAVLLFGSMSNPAQSSAEQPTQPIVWVFGTSIPWGVGTTDPLHGTSWPGRLGQLAKGAGQPITIRNYAVGGSALHSTNGPTPRIGDEISEQVRTALAERPGEIPALVLVDAGINDMVTHDTTSLIQTMYAAIEVDLLLQSRGITNKWWLTVLPLGAGATANPAIPLGWTANIKARIDQWNRWLLAMGNTNPTDPPNQLTDGFRVIDQTGVFGEDPATGLVDSTVLTADRIHPTDAGAMLIALNVWNRTKGTL